MEEGEKKGSERGSVRWGCDESTTLDIEVYPQCHRFCRDESDFTLQALVERCWQFARSLILSFSHTFNVYAHSTIIGSVRDPYTSYLQADKPPVLHSTFAVRGQNTAKF